MHIPLSTSGNSYLELTIQTPGSSNNLSSMDGLFLPQYNNHTLAGWVGEGSIYDGVGEYGSNAALSIDEPSTSSGRYDQMLNATLHEDAGYIATIPFFSNPTSLGDK